MKLLSGVYSDYSGEMLLDGQAGALCLARRCPGARHWHGLPGTEHLPAPDSGREPVQPPAARRGGLIDWGRMIREAQAHLHELGMDIDVTTRMGELSVGTQQIVEIARVIFSGARIIMLDEPTSALSPPETRRLFEFIATLKSQGKTMIFVSHFLEDVLEVADRITVLKNAAR